MIILINAIAFGYLAYSLLTLIDSIVSGNFKINWNCNKCLTFWGVLIVSGGDIVLASLTSFVVFLLDNHVTKL